MRTVPVKCTELDSNTILQFIREKGFDTQAVVDVFVVLEKENCVVKESADKCSTEATGVNKMLLSKLELCLRQMKGWLSTEQFLVFVK